MDKIENLTLTKEMIAALKEVRDLQDSGTAFSTDDLKNPISHLYSENLVEPVTLEVNGEKVMSCELTETGRDVLKYLDEKDKPHTELKPGSES